MFETDLGLVFLIEFFSCGSDLPTFELSDLDRAPSLRSVDIREDFFLARSFRNLDDLNAQLRHFNYANLRSQASRG